MLMERIDKLADKNTAGAFLGGFFGMIAGGFGGFLAGFAIAFAVGVTAWPAVGIVILAEMIIGLAGSYGGMLIGAGIQHLISSVNSPKPPPQENNYAAHNSQKRKEKTEEGDLNSNNQFRSLLSFCSGSRKLDKNDANEETEQYGHFPKLFHTSRSPSTRDDESLVTRFLTFIGLKR